MTNLSLVFLSSLSWLTWPFQVCAEKLFNSSRLKVPHLFKINIEKVTARLSNGKNDIYLKNGFIETNKDSKIVVNNISIYWRYKNIHKDNRDVVVTDSSGGQTVLQFGMGYWTFDMISERFTEEGVSLKKNRHNNTCRIRSEKHSLNLGNFGLLLGFEKDTVIQSEELKDSDEVNVNMGLRFVSIGCDIVNPSKNFDTNGERSKIIATFPITTEEPLFNYVSFYKDVNFEAPVINGTHNLLKFFVDTNIEETVEMNILIECYIK